jgi:hypothetical protein
MQKEKKRKQDDLSNKWIPVAIFVKVILLQWMAGVFSMLNL